MSDIVERLRLDAEPSEDDMETAAQEIEKLREALQTARRNALEEAALIIDDSARRCTEGGVSQRILESNATAIRALEGGK